MADTEQRACHSDWNKHKEQGVPPEIREGFLRVVMLELGFEGKGSSLRGKLEKGIPDRGSGVGKSLEPEAVRTGGRGGRAPRDWDGG